MAYRENGHNPAVIFCVQAKLDAMPLRKGDLEVFGQGICSSITALIMPTFRVQSRFVWIDKFRLNGPPVIP